MARNFDDNEANPFAAPESDLTPERYRSKGDTPTYGSFLERFAAAFLDGLLLGIVQLAIIVPIGMAMGGFVDFVYRFETPIRIFGFIMQWIYSTTMEASESGATLGKRAVGLRVTNLDGDQITFGQANGRFFGKILSVITLLIGYLMQPFTARKQALHDILAGTLVVKK